MKPLPSSFNSRLGVTLAAFAVYEITLVIFVLLTAFLKEKAYGLCGIGFSSLSLALVLWLVWTEEERGAR